MFRPRIVQILVVLLAATLISCGGGKKTDAALGDVVETTGKITEQTVYNRAIEQMRYGQYVQAIVLLEFLVERYPFGRFGIQARLNLLYLRMLTGDFDTVVTEAQQFLELNAQHANADYVHFMKAMATYTADRWLVTRLFGLDQPLRDIAPAHESFQLLREFVLQYSDSPYAPIARHRMQQLREAIARSEIGVAVFYLDHHAWLAAANRATYVIQSIQGSSYSDFALAIHAHAHRMMGIDDLYERTRDVLKLNYPESSFLKSNGEVTTKFSMKNQERTLTNILTLGMFQPPLEIDSTYNQ